MATSSLASTVVAGIAPSGAKSPPSLVVAGTYANRLSPRQGVTLTPALIYPADGLMVGQVWPEYIDPLSERSFAIWTSVSLSPSGIGTGVIELPHLCLVAGIETSKPARVRLYPTVDDRDYDLNRGIIQEPIQNVWMDYVTVDTTLDMVSPPIQITGGTIPISVQNMGTEGPVIVTIHYLEAR